MCEIDHSNVHIHVMDDALVGVYVGALTFNVLLQKCSLCAAHE